MLLLVAQYTTGGSQRCDAEVVANHSHRTVAKATVFGPLYMPQYIDLASDRQCLCTCMQRSGLRAFTGAAITFQPGNTLHRRVALTCSV